MNIFLLQLVTQGNYNEVFANETSLVANQIKSTKVTCDAELTF